MSAREQLLLGGILAVAAAVVGALRLLLIGDTYEDRTVLGADLPWPTEAALLVAGLAQATFAMRVRSSPAALAAAALLAVFVLGAYTGTGDEEGLGFVMCAPLSGDECVVERPSLGGWPLALAVAAVPLVVAGLVRVRRR